MSRPVSVLDRSAYLWMWTAGRKWTSREDLLAQLAGAGYTIIKPKVLDGCHWMAEFDARRDPRSGDWISHPWAFDGPDSVNHFIDLARSFGLDCIPWTVVRGRNPEAELQRWLELRAVDVVDLELDLEPYKGFYEGTAGDLVDMVQRAARQGIRLVVDAHVSGYTTRALPFEALVPHVRLFLGQSYWTTFQRYPADVIQYEADYWASIGAADWGSIFPAGDPDGFAAAAQVVAERDGSELGLWALHTTTTAAMETLGSIS